MVFINGFIVITLLAVSGFLYGFLLFLSDYEENKCEMTYMFQYPQFVHISMEVDNNLNKYGLYSYSEGQRTGKARNMHFNGIPVLFIPGNAGSYKQVRSLASVALRKALNSKPGFHFDYFTIDFNDELSGLNGALLHEQVVFAKQSVYKILELYASNAVKPTSVILVGHSMGGIVAEGLLLSLMPNHDVISLVITLATPHKRPTLFFDEYLHEFYKNIKSWDNKMNTTFISVFGGFNDFLVPSHLTASKHLNVASTHIPKTWLPMDHLCILWCKQLVLVLNRALFDAVDLQTKQISLDKEYVISIFKHHLLQNSGTNIALRNPPNALIPIDERGNWIEYLPRQYTVDLIDGVKQVHWYMVRVVKQPMHEILSILALNLEVSNWIYVCSANTIREHNRVCIDGKHLSHLSEIAPTIRQKRRFLNINLHQFAGNFTHVVVKVPPTSERTTLQVDVHSEADRKLIVNLPSWWSLSKRVIIEETPENYFYYELHFPELNHVVQSYQLFVEARQCKTQGHHHATASLTAPWSNLDQHAVFTETQKKPMNLRLYSNKPSNMTNTSAFVRLILDQNCRYAVSIKFDIPNTFAQLARFYSPLVLANVVIVVLLCLKSQLHQIDAKKRCSLFFTALMTDTKPYYVLPVARISTLILSYVAAIKTLPITDIQVLDEEGIGFGISMFLYLTSIGIVWILAMFLVISIFCFESTVHNIFVRFISKSVIGTSSTYDWMFKGLKQFPMFVAFILLIISVSTCGGLALCLGLIYYFHKLTQLAQDVVENILLKLIESIANRFKISTQVKQKILRFIVRDALSREGSDVTANSENEQERTQRGERVAKPDADGAGTSKNEENAVEEDESECSDESNDVETNGNVSESIRGASEGGAGSQNNEESATDSILGIFREIFDNSQLYFHFTIFCLWFLVTMINIPTVLIWAHNFKYSSSLDTDPSFMPAITLCTSAFMLWQFEFPFVQKKWYKELGWIVYFFTIYSAIYGTISIYRLNYVLSAIVALVTLHQLLAPKRSDASEDDGVRLDNSLGKTKMKMD